jgi:LysM repeat protein
MIIKNKLNTVRYFLPVMVLLLITTSCNTTRRRPTRSKRFHPVENAGLKERVKVIEKTVSNQDIRLTDLSFQMKQLIETNNKSVQRINQLTKENIELKNKIVQLERNTMLLADNLDKEKNARTDQNNRLINDIAKRTTALINSNNAEINKMLNNIQQTRRSSVRKASPSVLGNTRGNFYEYKVQSGATLIAIAKAYKVTVAEIKQANNLKNNNIRVGQKLYIPKK